MVRFVLCWRYPLARSSTRCLSGLLLGDCSLRLSWWAEPRMSDSPRPCHRMTTRQRAARDAALSLSTPAVPHARKQPPVPRPGRGVNDDTAYPRLSCLKASDSVSASGRAVPWVDLPPAVWCLVWQHLPAHVDKLLHCNRLTRRLLPLPPHAFHREEVTLPLTTLLAGSNGRHIHTGSLTHTSTRHLLTAASHVTLTRGKPVSHAYRCSSITSYCCRARGRRESAVSSLFPPLFQPVAPTQTSPLRSLALLLDLPYLRRVLDELTEQSACLPHLSALMCVVSAKSTRDEQNDFLPLQRLSRLSSLCSLTMAELDLSKAMIKTLLRLPLITLDLRHCGLPDSVYPWSSSSLHPRLQSFSMPCLYKKGGGWRMTSFCRLLASPSFLPRIRALHLNGSLTVTAIQALASVDCVERLQVGDAEPEGESELPSAYWLHLLVGRGGQPLLPRLRALVVHDAYAKLEREVPGLHGRVAGASLAQQLLLMREVTCSFLSAYSSQLEELCVAVPCLDLTLLASLSSLSLLRKLRLEHPCSWYDAVLPSELQHTQTQEEEHIRLHLHHTVPLLSRLFSLVLDNVFAGEGVTLRLLQLCPALQALDISGSQLTSNLLVHLSQHCRQLQVLNTNGGTIRLTESSLHTVLPLRCLHTFTCIGPDCFDVLALVRFFRPSPLQYLAIHCPSHPLTAVEVAELCNLPTLRVLGFLPRLLRFLSRAYFLSSWPLPLPGTTAHPRMPLSQWHTLHRDSGTLWREQDSELHTVFGSSECHGFMYGAAALREKGGGRNADESGAAEEHAEVGSTTAALHASSARLAGETQGAGAAVSVASAVARCAVRANIVSAVAELLVGVGLRCVVALDVVLAASLCGVRPDWVTQCLMLQCGCLVLGAATV